MSIQLTWHDSVRKSHFVATRSSDDHSVAGSTVTRRLVQIKPKQANEQSAHDTDCNHILAPTELNVVNRSETEGVSSRRSLCDAQPDRVSRPLCHRATNVVPLLWCSARSDSEKGQLIGSQVVIFRTSAFLRRSMNEIAVRPEPSPAEREVTEPFARVFEPAHQI